MSSSVVAYAVGGTGKDSSCRIYVIKSSANNGQCIDRRLSDVDGCRAVDAAAAAHGVVVDDDDE